MQQSETSDTDVTIAQQQALASAMAPIGERMTWQDKGVKVGAAYVHSSGQLIQDVNATWTGTGSSMHQHVSPTLATTAAS
jgi:hypothetical protein